MPRKTLELADAAELADMITFLTDWLAHSQRQPDTLRTDLHRFAFLLGVSDGGKLFGEPAP